MEEASTIEPHIHRAVRMVCCGVCTVYSGADSLGVKFGGHVGILDYGFCHRCIWGELLIDIWSDVGHIGCSSLCTANGQVRLFLLLGPPPKDFRAKPHPEAAEALIHTPAPLRRGSRSDAGGDGFPVTPGRRKSTWCEAS